MKTEIQDIMHELDILLESERDALTVGNLDYLNKVVQEKEDLMAALDNAAVANDPGMSGISGKITRNQKLLEHALDGIREVARKLAEIQRVRKEFGTYTQLGEINKVEADLATSVEKRA